MMKNKSSVFKSFMFLLFLGCAFRLNSLDLSNVDTAISDIFINLSGASEGTTSFRSLLIPLGGRTESLGGAYTGLCNDISFFDFNPAASCTLENTELAFFHSSWIADSSIETLAFTTRFNNFGVGAKVSCFYIPFTEYDVFGNRVASSYYSESTGTLNLSYIIHPGYTFKGLAIGLNAKAAYRAVPDYTDNDTGAILTNSGLNQSAIAVMADTGLLFQFNFAKFYYSRTANFKFGLSATNLGIAFTGLAENIVIDDGLPSTIGIGLSYSPLSFLTFAWDFRQTFNFLDFTEYLMWYTGLGVQVKITDFFSVLGGFQLKGANPRFSIGSQFAVKTIIFNVNYTLDLTSSFTPVNRISLSAKLNLGDKGRKEKQKQVDEFYKNGVECFANRQYQKAIEYWQQALKIDKYFDPASTGIKIAQEYNQMLEEYQEAFSNK